MKKFFYLMSLCLCMFAGVAVMTSCGDDEEDVDDKGGNTTPAPASVEMEFRFFTGGLLYVGTHFEINYEVGNDKGTKTDAEASATWLYLSTVKFPCTIKFSRTFTINEEYPGLFVADHSFDYETGYNFTYRFLDADGKLIEGSENSISNVTSDTVDGETMAGMINQGKLNSEVIFVFDKDGKLVK